MTLFNPVYIARRQDDGTWSIFESKTGRVADIGGCVLRRLDARMAAGLAQDLNNPIIADGHDRRAAEMTGGE